MILEAYYELSSSTDKEVIITTKVVLNSSESIIYRRLDSLLRKHHYDTDVMDAVSDYGFSYSNDILSTIYWDRLEDLLKEVTRIIKRNTIIEKMPVTLTQAIRLDKFVNTFEGIYLWDGMKVVLVFNKESVFIMNGHGIELDEDQFGIINANTEEFSENVKKYYVEGYTTIDEVNYIFIKEGGKDASIKE